eukprot:gene22909-biopygen1218
MLVAQGLCFSRVGTVQPLRPRRLRLHARDRTRAQPFLPLRRRRPRRVRPAGRRARGRGRMGTAGECGRRMRRGAPGHPLLWGMCRCLGTACSRGKDAAGKRRKRHGGKNPAENTAGETVKKTRRGNGEKDTAGKKPAGEGETHGGKYTDRAPPLQDQATAQSGANNRGISFGQPSRNRSATRAPGAQLIRVGAGSGLAFQRLSRDTTFSILSSWWLPETRFSGIL